MQNFTMTQAQLDAWNKPLKEISRKAAQAGPHRPWLRRGSEVKLDIQRLIAERKDTKEGIEGILPRFRRNLSEKIAHRDELKSAIKRVNEQIADSRKSGIDERSNRMLELLGYDFESKITKLIVHHDGTLDLLQAELAETERRIVVLTEAVRNTEKRVERELPKLKAELAEAIKREGLLL
jgi:hypothetical protein